VSAPAASAVTVRAPGPADVEAMAALLAAAFPAAESTLLGSAYLRAFASWFARRAQPLSRVAVEEGALVGVVVGLRDDEMGALYRWLLPRAVVAAARRPWALLRPAVARMAAQRLAGLVAPPAAQAGVLLHTIAVQPAQRGRGVGAALLDAFAAGGRATGAGPVHLRVLAINDGARRFYTRHGWRELPEPAGGRRVAYVAPELQGSSRGPGSPSGRAETPAAAVSSSSSAGSSPGLT